MANRYVAICLGLVCLVMLAGCADPVVEPEGVQPANPTPPEAPNAPEVVEASETIRPEAPEPNDTAGVPRQMPTDAGVTPEPNMPDSGDLPQEPPTVQEWIFGSNTAETIEPNALEAVEPNGVDAGATEDSEVVPSQATVEPNEVPAGEPNEPAVEVKPKEQGPAVQGQAAALPGFIERYTEILQDYVRQDGRVDYGALRRKRVQMKQLLMKLDDLDPDVYAVWSPEEKLAFWLNAYNLKMLETIARNYPIESSWWLRLTWPPSDIRHIKGIWTDYKFIVMDEEFTLTEVERRFFRKTFGDPRAYLAITYATRSSPRLRRQPYLGASLEQQLDKQVREFLSDPRAFRIDRREKVVHLSALFKPSWRGKEFFGRYGTDKRFKDRDAETRAVLNFITNYLDREEVYFLETENYSLKYVNFDWRINDTSRGF